MDTMHATFRAYRRYEAPPSRSQSPPAILVPEYHGVESPPPDDQLGSESSQIPDIRCPSPASHSGPPSVSPPASEQDHDHLEFHPLLDGTPCDIHGYDLPPGSAPPPPDERPMNDYSPYATRAEFEFAEFIFAEEQMSGAKLDKHLNNLAALYPDSPPPFANHEEMYSVIDATKEGDIPWQSFSVSYNGDLPDDGNAPPWMTAQYDVWYRDPLLSMEQQIGNPSFAEEIDFAPKRIFDKDNKRQYTDLMSGNWAWGQAVC
jgi:Plavaka transposase